MKDNSIKNILISEVVYNNLPPIIKSLTIDFNGRERDIVLLSSIGVLSSCIPNVFGFYDGDEVFANLFLIIIAPPASGKGVMNYSKILIQKIHDKTVLDSKITIKECNEENKKTKEKNVSECPPFEIKVIPANISSAEMYTYIGASKYGALIIESEADTMSNMFKNDWSNYSDVLRKAFHHEPISISRKIEKIYEDIREPKLSLVMSGTPNQLQPLIKSKENGLFSRFMLYTFDEISNFKNVFAPKSKDYKISFEQASQDVYCIYNFLAKKTEKIEFKLTESQNKKFVEEFTKIHEVILNNHPNSFLSNLNRHGLILFRICMILSVMRTTEKTEDLIICNNRDFLISLKIVKAILFHALIVHNTIEDCALSEFDEKLLFDLPKVFTRKNAIDIGAKYEVPTRTIDDKLVQWRKKKAIKKNGHGKFERTLK